MSAGCPSAVANGIRHFWTTVKGSRRAHSAAQLNQLSFAAILMLLTPRTIWLVQNLMKAKRATRRKSVPVLKHLSRQVLMIPSEYSNKETDCIHGGVTLGTAAETKYDCEAVT